MHNPAPSQRLVILWFVLSVIGICGDAFLWLHR